jgi:hypothetical protein
MKTATIELSAKEPDTFGEMCDELGASDEARARFLRWGEYATIELVVDENFNIVGGRFLPVVDE